MQLFSLPHADPISLNFNAFYHWFNQLSGTISSLCSIHIHHIAGNGVAGTLLSQFHILRKQRLVPSLPATSAGLWLQWYLALTFQSRIRKQTSAMSVTVFVDFLHLCSTLAFLTITPTLPLCPHFALLPLPSAFSQVCLFVSTWAQTRVAIRSQRLKGSCNSFLLVGIWLNYSRPSVCQSGGIYSRCSPIVILDNRERSEVTGTNQPEGKRKKQDTGERERRKYAAIVFCYQENDALQEADTLFSRPTCLSKQRHPNRKLKWGYWNDF